MEIIDYIALGRRIRKVRKSRRLSQEELAELVNISASYFGHVERGSRKASIETLLAIATALETTPDELMCDSLQKSTGRETTPDLVRQMIDARRMRGSDSKRQAGGQHGASELFCDFEELVVSMLMSAFYYGAQCAKHGLLLEPLEE